ncbi:MAG: ACP S-malonyltransferase [Polyangia bacterium]
MIAFLFPGQGAQEVGMGRDLIGREPGADELIALASELTGEDAARLCRRGPPGRLAETRLLQPLLSAVGLALWSLLERAGVRPDVAAGHSLGEIPALAACGLAAPEDALRLAARRGQLMHEAAQRSSGAMIAVTGPPSELVERAVAALSWRGIVSLAAVNAPTQTTISGDPDLVAEVAATLRAGSEAKITPLRVSGAWHSEQMEPARQGFAAALAKTPLAPRSEVPIVCNRDGEPTEDAGAVREKLAAQLTSPIRWDLAMRRMAELGVGDFVEIGPGRVLRGLVRLNLPDPELRVHNVSDRRSAERTIDQLS